MKKFLKIGAIAVAALCLIAGILLSLVDVDQFRPMIQSKMEAALNRKVTLGKMALKIFPLSVRAEQLTIDEHPLFQSSTPFLTAKEISVKVDLIPLLSKQIKVDSVRILEPSVELIKQANGIWNIPGMNEGGPTPSSSSPGSDITLSELLLDDGKIGLTDKQAKKPRVQYDNIDIALRDLAPGKPFTLNTTVRFPDKLEATTKMKAIYDQAASKLDLQSFEGKLGGLSLTGSGSVAAATSPAVLDLQLQTANASITELAKVASMFGTAFAPDMKVTGNLSANVKMTGRANQPQLAGDVSFASLVVERNGWKQPVRMPQVKIQLTPESMQSNTFVVEAGGTKLNASFGVQDYTGKPRISADLNTRGANLGELLQVAQAYGVSATDGIQASGTVSLDIKLTGPASDLDYQGTGSLENAVLQLPTLTKPLNIKTASLKFDEGKAVLENLNATLASSNLQGSMKIRNFSAPEIEFNANIDNVNTAELEQISKPAPEAKPAPGAAKQTTAAAQRPIMKMRGKGTLNVGKIQSNGITLTKVRAESTLDKGVLRMEPLTAELFGGAQKGSITVDMRNENTAFAVQTKVDKASANEVVSATTNIKNVLFGMLGAEANLSAAPKPGEEVAKSLNGTVSLNLNNGKLAGVSIVNEMAKLSKALGYSEKSDVVTNILSLTGTLKIVNGNATTDDLKMVYSGGSLTAAGNVNLVDTSMKMKVTSILSSEMANTFGGGTKVGGYLTTALTNNKGEIVIPCLVTGTAAKPIFVPDAAEFGRLKLKSILPSAGNAGSLATGVLGAIEGGQKNGAKGVGGALLDIFGGKKPAEKKKDQ